VPSVDLQIQPISDLDHWFQHQPLAHSLGAFWLTHKANINIMVKKLSIYIYKTIIQITLQKICSVQANSISAYAWIFRSSLSDPMWSRTSHQHDHHNQHTQNVQSQKLPDKHGMEKHQPDTLKECRGHTAQPKTTDPHLW
jgi:hypothetical protein